MQPFIQNDITKGGEKIIIAEHMEQNIKMCKKRCIQQNKNPPKQEHLINNGDIESKTAKHFILCISAYK